MRITPGFSKKLFIPIVLFFFASSLYIHTHTYINWDVSWLLEASKRLLAGGTYTQNFMETNPPLILFIYSIPVLLTSWVGNITSNFFIFTYALIFISLSFNCMLLNKIMAKDSSTWLLFISGIAFCELILPCYEFGQREHLTLLFTLPYLLLVSDLNTLKFPLFLRICIGLLAGIGFAIKPYFLIPLTFIIGWKLYKNRSLTLTFFSIENGCLVSVMATYLIACFIITPDYFSYILPLVFKFYLVSKETLFQLLTYYPLAILFYIITLLGFMQLKQKTHPYQNLYQLLMLTNFGFFLVYIIGGRFFYYHFLPVSTLLTLLLLFDIQSIVKKLIRKNSISYLDYFQIILTAYCVYFVLNWVIVNDRMKLSSDTDGPIPLIIKFFQKNNHGSFMVFSNHLATNATLLLYSKLPSTTRIHQFWILYGVGKLEKLGKFALAAEGKDILQQIIIQDLLRDPPYIIVVDETSSQLSLNGVVMNNLQFLLQNEEFKKIWTNYQLKTRVKTDYDAYAIYTLRA